MLKKKKLLIVKINYDEDIISGTYLLAINYKTFSDEYTQFVNVVIN